MQKFSGPSNPNRFFFFFWQGDTFRKGWAWTSSAFSGINKKGDFLLRPIRSPCKTVTNCTPPLRVYLLWIYSFSFHFQIYWEDICVKSDGGISSVVQRFDIKPNFYTIQKTREELKVNGDVAYAKKTYIKNTAVDFFDGKTKLPEA